jgi:hypothetical protein
MPAIRHRTVAYHDGAPVSAADADHRAPRLGVGVEAR